jgi:hypothetical protein
MLAAFLVQPEPPAGALRPKILHLHFERSRDAREGIGEGGDQRTVPQVSHGFGRDRGEELAPMSGVEHWRLAGLHHVLRAAHGRGRIYRHHLAGDEQETRLDPDIGEGRGRTRLSCTCRTAVQIEAEDLRATGRLAMASVDTRAIEGEIDRIRSLGLEELRREWRRLNHAEPLRISRDLLMMAGFPAARRSGQP